MEIGTSSLEKETVKEKIVGFVWQHVLLLASLYFMTLGVALCVRSNLGSGVISAIPMVLSLAGADGLAPGMTIGGYTNVMNIIFVLLQMAILRRRFERIQLLQIVVGFVFGTLLDLNMALTGLIDFDAVPLQIAGQLAGCTVLARP